MKIRFCKQCLEKATVTGTFEKMKRMVVEGKLKPPCLHGKRECCKIILERAA